MHSNMFDAIIFDWDGTLANTKKVITDSFKKALEKVNSYPSNKLIERYIGIGSSKTLKEILNKEQIIYDEKLIESLVEIKVKYSIRFSKDVKLMKGSKKLLEILKPKIKIGLASMNKRKFIENLLVQFNLSDFFNAIVTSDDISEAKPNPEIFLKCAKDLDVDPYRCVVLEDSIFGVRAAKYAGMACIAVLTGAYNQNEIFAESPDLIVDSLIDRQRIMDFIFH